MQRFEDKSLNLLLLQIIGPVLIILMVSSLVFFLIEVVYRGPHTARMYWVYGLFTMAAVLVARISIEEGKDRAMLYGLGLAIATLIASMQLVEFSILAVLRPLILIGLIAVVLWTANKLTWDCTVVDSSRDVSSSGLWERLKRVWTKANIESESAESTAAKFWHFLVSGSKANAPGTWVIYFALVAFPIFGLGQWFVRPEAANWVYLLFALYFASALGLLLTTSLLGLERYLARRNVHVPGPIARNWILLGGGFAITVMLLVWLMPKPAGSSSLHDALAALTSPFKETSDLAPGNDGIEEKPDARNQRIDRNAKPANGNRDNPDARGNQDNNQGGNQGDKRATGQGDGDRVQREADRQGGDSQSRRPPRQVRPSDQTQQQQSDQQDRNLRPADQNQNQNQHQEAEQGRQQDGQGRPQDRQPRADPEPLQQQPQQSVTTSVLEQISKWINWLVYLIGIIAAVVLLVLFRNELIGLLKLLFGRRQKEDTDSQEQSSALQSTVSVTPFARFKNPFRSGATRASLHQLVNYSMLALQAWGHEFGIDRREDETPHEFARRLQSVDPPISKLAFSLGDLYNECAFGGRQKMQADVRCVQELWQRMETTFRDRHTQPLTTTAAS